MDMFVGVCENPSTGKKQIQSLERTIQCEAPKISKLVQITPITMVCGTYNELVTGAFVN